MRLIIRKALLAIATLIVMTGPVSTDALAEPPMEFIDAVGLIVARGEIRPDSANRLEAFLIAHPGAEWIRLNSAGGNLLAGLELGRVIRRFHLRTYIGGPSCDSTLLLNRIRAGPGRQAIASYDIEICTRERGECLSACAYAFLGGIERVLVEPLEREAYHMPKGAFGENEQILGFHQFRSSAAQAVTDQLEDVDRYAEMASTQAQYLSSVLAKYVQEMGVNLELLQVASNARDGELIYPNREQLNRMNVLFNARYERFEFVSELIREGSDVSAVARFSAGGAWTKQIGVYCGGRDRYPRKPRLVVSKAKMTNGREWWSSASALFPSPLGGITALKRKLLADHPDYVHYYGQPREAQRALAPPQLADGARLKLSNAPEPGFRVAGDRSWIFYDEDWKHFAMWPSDDFWDKLLDSDYLVIQFDAPEVSDLRSERILLNSQDRKSISAAIASCRSR